MRDSQSAKLRFALLSAALFAVVLTAVLTVFSRFALPNYGAWTGFQPLETKIFMLDDFSKRGDVDALVMGSSIVDFGFRADLFSELMTRERGKEFRAFNFATGGAQLRTLPKLYRLARTVNKPKNVYIIAPAEPRLPEALQAGSPDLTLQNAPVGEVLYHPFLLQLSQVFRATPVMRNAPAIRDLALFGDFRTLGGKIGMEAYAVDDNGDRISYLMTWKVSDLPLYKAQYERQVRPYPAAASGAPDPLEKRAEHFFARRDIDAVRELRQLVEADGAKLHIFAHAGAAGLWGGWTLDEGFKKGRQEFFNTLAELAGATVVDPIPMLDIPPHGVSDVTHLNTYGAAAYTRAAFAAVTGKTGYPVDDNMKPPPDGLFPTKDPSFTPYSALLLRPANQAHPLLHFRLVRSQAVPPIPAGDLSAAIRTPDNKEIVVTAAAIGPGDYIVEVDLPPAAQPEGYVVRLVTGPKSDLRALGNPVADYEWLTSFPRLASKPPKRVEGVQVLALPSSRAAGENLYVALKSDKPLPQTLDLRLAPSAPTPGDVLNLGKLPLQKDGFLKVAVPTAVNDGTYTLDVLDAANGAKVGTSQPISMTARNIPVEVALGGTPRAQDSYIVVNWSGIRTPTAQDWIGLFPAGQKDDNRLGFQFTGGAREGTMNFVITPAIGQMPGELEFRVYAAGGWRMIGKGEPFRFEPGKSKMADPAPTIAAAAPAAPASNAKVSVDPKSPIVNGVLRVAWSGIEKPNAKDWVGLFPVGGDDSGRVSFIFLPGKASGEIELMLPAGFAEKLVSGDYEMRLFSSGRWDLLARSDRIKLAAPAAPAVPAAVSSPSAPAAKVEGK